MTGKAKIYLGVETRLRLDAVLDELVITQQELERREVVTDADISGEAHVAALNRLFDTIPQAIARLEAEIRQLLGVDRLSCPRTGPLLCSIPFRSSFPMNSLQQLIDDYYRPPGCTPESVNRPKGFIWEAESGVPVTSRHRVPIYLASLMHCPSTLSGGSCASD